MNILIKIAATIVVAALVIVLVIFGFRKKNDPNHIKVGVIAGLEQQLAEVAKQVAKKRYDLNVEFVIFNDYVLPNEALNNGDIDANSFQHKPFLDKQIADRSYKLAIVANTFVYPIAGYSNKIKSLDELKPGSQIALPNDPTNLGRSLLLLQKIGLIELKPGVGLLPRTVDVIKNPKNLKLAEVDAPLLPRFLDDPKVSVAVINNTYAGQAGLHPTKDGLFVEEKDSPYVNIIVARENNKNAENVQKFVRSYQSDEVAKAAVKIFNGDAVKGW
ncbi:MAG: MetQ/NlpA family lipoprotein [Candidatus Liberibacter ctenarytainae]|uniref:Lipoprotein n=1 Tax=Candidatus Liberibacter ctenarytainae TaxID=2020335 RepID=A0A937APR4_9HYPH|nr:MetQ/NlpA family lipoprotein [Candidatus Liberibacter ctenarytainae]